MARASKLWLTEQVEESATSLAPPPPLVSIAAQTSSGRGTAIWQYGPYPRTGFVGSWRRERGSRRSWSRYATCSAPAFLSPCASRCLRVTSFAGSCRAPRQPRVVSCHLHPCCASAFARRKQAWLLPMAASLRLLCLLAGYSSHRRTSANIVGCSFRTVLWRSLCTIPSWLHTHRRCVSQLTASCGS